MKANKNTPVTWFLVADSKYAQLYTRSCIGRHIPRSGNSRQHHYSGVLDKRLVPVAGMYMEADSDYETGKERLGRVYESATSTRHMAEPHVDIHKEIASNFMKAIVARLSMARNQKSYDRLVLVAPAGMLGELRECLPVQVKKTIVAELAKDLTGCNDNILSGHLRNIG